MLCTIPDLLLIFWFMQWILFHEAKGKTTNGGQIGRSICLPALHRNISSGKIQSRNASGMHYRGAKVFGDAA